MVRFAAPSARRRAWSLACALVVACAPGAAPPPVAELSVPRIDAAPPPAIAAAPSADAGDPPPYTANAADAFARAEDALARDDLDGAERGYRDVVRRFAYSRYAAEAELRIADIAYRHASYAEAARLYEKWMVDHRSHLDRLDEVRAKQLDARKRAGL